MMASVKLDRDFKDICYNLQVNHLKGIEVVQECIIAGGNEIKINNLKNSGREKKRHKTGQTVNNQMVD